MEGGEGKWMYNPKIGMVNNLRPSIANIAMANNLRTSLENVPLDIPPTVQVPEFRDADSLPLGLHHPPDDSDLGGEPWTAGKMTPPPPTHEI